MPSPSGVAFSFARNSANSETWNALILRHLRELVGIVAVVRERVVRVGDADLGIGAGAGLAGELEGDDAGDVALQRQHLQVEHQPGVVGVGGGHADGPVEIRQVRIGGRGLGLLDAALDLADGVEVLARPCCGRPGRACVCRRAISSVHRVEQAGALPQRGEAVGGAAAVAEQALEDDARMRLGRQRRRRRRPREVVLVDAGVAVVALADGREQVHRQLERRQLRLLADLLGGDLVDGRAEVVVACSRSASPWRRSGRRRWRSRACRGRRSAAPGW